jgi:hypothetical protein
MTQHQKIEKKKSGLFCDILPKNEFSVFKKIENEVISQVSNRQK